MSKARRRWCWENSSFDIKIYTLGASRYVGMVCRLSFLNMMEFEDEKIGGNLNDVCDHDLSLFLYLT